MTNDKLYNILSGITRIDTKQNELIKTTSGQIGFISGVLGTGWGEGELTGTVAGYFDSVADSLVALNAKDEFLSGAMGSGWTETDNIRKAINEITTSAVKVSGAADNAVQVSGDVSKTVGLVIDTSTNNILSQSAAGLKATIALSSIQYEPTDPTMSGYTTGYKLVDGNGNQLGDTTINIPRDQFLSGVTLEESQEVPGQFSLVFKFKLADGNPSTITVPLTSMFQDYKGLSGVNIGIYQDGDNKRFAISGVVDTDTESFLSLGANGFKVTGVSGFVADSVSAAKTALETRIDAIDNATSGTVHVVSAALDAEVERAKGAEQALTGMIQALDYGPIGDGKKVITYVSQTDGLLSAVAEDMTADNVVYSDTYGDTRVSGALDRIFGAKTVEGSIDYKIDAYSTAYDNALSGIDTKVQEILTEMGL